MSSICIYYVERSKDKPLHEKACPNFWLVAYIHSSICVVVSARILPVESSVGTDTDMATGASLFLMSVCFSCNNFQAICPPLAL